LLLKAAEHGGPFCFVARVAVSRTLHGVIGVGPTPDRQDMRRLEGKASREETLMTRTD
jgi:hypothetical protein